MLVSDVCMPKREGGRLGLGNDPPKTYDPLQRSHIWSRDRDTCEICARHVHDMSKIESG